MPCGAGSGACLRRKACSSWPGKRCKPHGRLTDKHVTVQKSKVSADHKGALTFFFAALQGNVPDFRGIVALHRAVVANSRIPKKHCIKRCFRIQTENGTQFWSCINCKFQESAPCCTQSAALGEQFKICQSQRNILQGCTCGLCRRDNKPSAARP